MSSSVFRPKAVIRALRKLPSKDDQIVCAEAAELWEAKIRRDIVEMAYAQKRPQLERRSQN